MEPIQMAKQMIEINKTTFENGFNAMVLIQEQTEKMVSSFLEQAPWVPEAGRKGLNDWINACKTGRSGLKSAVDQSFKNVESCFGQACKTDNP
jgi:hypothetical protein